MVDALVALDRTMQDAARAVIAECVRYGPPTAGARAASSVDPMQRVDGVGIGEGQWSDGAATADGHAAFFLTPVVMAVLGAVGDGGPRGSA